MTLTRDILAFEVTKHLSHDADTLFALVKADPGLIPMYARQSILANLPLTNIIKGRLTFYIYSKDPCHIERVIRRIKRAFYIDHEINVLKHWMSPVCVILSVISRDASIFIQGLRIVRTLVREPFVSVTTPCFELAEPHSTPSILCSIKGIDYTSPTYICPCCFVHNDKSQCTNIIIP